MDREYARKLDADDELRGFRDRFLIPRRQDGSEKIYLCGNSLGLQPKATAARLMEELKVWAEKGVEGHFEEPYPWYSYHEPLQEPMAAVVGALPSEVVAMNSLTTNLHVLMASFYRPTKGRFKILIERGAFPSDLYAVQSQAVIHGFDPEVAVVQVGTGREALETEEILEAIEEAGEELALVLFGGVNYYTGQFFDLKAITAAGHRVGARVGFDLAHAAGNVPLKLHEWGPDFAAWCSYKYLNSGPGAVSGIFVHERHGDAPELPRFAGWWGTDPATRFQMGPTFTPQRGAAGWQLSNAPVLSMAALRASLEIFSEATMPALRRKSEGLTAFLAELLEAIPNSALRVLTPADPAARGCQISLHAPGLADTLDARLQAAGVVCDVRRPDVIRLAPVPLYNTYEEVWCFAQILREAL